MHYIASPLPGLLYRIQLCGHWRHCNDFTISKKPTFLLRKSQFFCAPWSFSKSTAYMDFYSQNGVCQNWNYRANCDVGVDFVFECGGWKYVEMANSIFLVRTPLTGHSEPLFLAGKSAKPAFERTWKGSETVKNSLFGHLMHYIASLLPGLLYRIQLCGHWRHFNGFTISKKPTFFCYENHGIFVLPDLFLRPRPM